MGSASNEAAGQRFIDEFGEDVLEAVRPRSLVLDALVDGMWLAVSDGWEDVRVFLRLRDGADTLVLAYRTRSSTRRRRTTATWSSS